MTMLERMNTLVRRTQDEICAALERVDGSRFREERWQRPGGGGGTSRVLEGGAVLEKAAVNVSAVHGTLSAEAAMAVSAGRDHLSGVDPRFAAAGVSLILHPRNPFAPAVHANYRYFERGASDAPVAWWFGGGSDLTPSYLFDEDARHFHGVLKGACDRHDERWYPRFKRWCDDYFVVQHRDERRGVGGIFFDDLDERPAEELYALVESCAGAFLPAYLPILERRKDTPYSPANRRWQEQRRGRYVEFNLLYDRGTRFGLTTHGRVESVLASLPPVARWDHDVQPAAGSPEARLVENLRHPRDWV